jgi:carbon-monoxide dehydrogenase iron sulfur subunit
MDAQPGQMTAVKCDNCIGRQSKGLTPACVEICKSNALTFEEPSEAMKRKTDEVARSVSSEMRSETKSPGFDLLNAVKKVQTELKSI